MNADVIFAEAEQACRIEGYVDTQCLIAYLKGVIRSLADDYNVVNSPEMEGEPCESKLESSGDLGTSFETT